MLSVVIVATVLTVMAAVIVAIALTVMAAVDAVTVIGTAPAALVAQTGAAPFPRGVSHPRVLPAIAVEECSAYRASAPAA
jgi:hypothetical protein